MKVRSESELRAGMTVVRTMCVRCNDRTHAEILLRTVQGEWCSGPGPHAVWLTAGDCSNDGGCYCQVIQMGKVYRLRDEADSTEQTRERERERVE